MNLVLEHMNATADRLVDRWRGAINTAMLCLLLVLFLSCGFWFYLAYVRDFGPPASYGEVNVLNPTLPAGTLLYMDVPVDKQRGCAATVGNALIVPVTDGASHAEHDYRLWLDRYPTYTAVGQSVERIAVMVPATLEPGPYAVVHLGGYACQNTSIYYPIQTTPVPITVTARAPVPVAAEGSP